MATTNKSFTFAASAESWSYTAGGDDTGTYDGTEEALDCDLIGRNSTATGYWEWTGTWEDLGVSSGQIISAVNLDFDWRCYVANVSDGYTTGPSAIYDSTGTTLIGTFSSGAPGSGTTSYATQSGTEVSIGSTYQASNTTIKLRISVSYDNGNDKVAQTSLYYDNIDLVITHNTPSTRRVFIIS